MLFLPYPTHFLSPNITTNDAATDPNLGEESTFHFQMMGINKDTVFSNKDLDEMVHSIRYVDAPSFC